MSSIRNYVDQLKEESSVHYDQCMTQSVTEKKMNHQPSGQPISIDSAVSKMLMCY